MALIETQKAILQLNRMAQEIDPAAPWDARHADEWDGQTFETWKLANTLTPNARKLLDLAIEALFSVQPREISLLFVLSTSAPPARWRCSSTPRVAPRSASSTPGLAARKDQLYQHLPMGSIGKSIAVYDSPFWRAKGLTGQATSDQTPVAATFDISPASGRPGVMMGFIDGQDARDFSLLSTAERRRRCLDQFAVYFGAEARSPREYHDMLWDELPLHRGCPVTSPGPGVLTGFRDALHAPDGPIHFASTETATVWAGYMDGAVRAGRAVAQAVAAEL